MLQVLLNNRYQIIKELGYGGFGTTYLAKDTQTIDSWCAIKKLNPEHADLNTAKQLFKREADTLMLLQEVHQVPKFIDYFEENNCSYIAEEYIEGDSLDSLLDYQWSMSNVTLFLWEILSILQLLHSKNIVHRDIKPSNLIRRKKDNKFTIIDFGAVKGIKPNQPQEVGTCIYHHGYAPIEQMQGVPRLNSDIHALGITAIQLLTKQPPTEFVRDNQDNLIEPKISAPTWLIDILNKMIRTDFNERYQSVEEVLKDISKRNEVTVLTGNNSPGNGGDLAETEQINNNGNIKNKTKANKNYRRQLLYLSLILLPLLLIGSELTKPWIRPWYYLNQGNKLLDKNQSQASLNQFKQVTDLKQDSAAGWKGRGDALFNLRRYSGALGAYNKAIAIDPENIKALNNKGKILHKLGQLPQAIAVYHTAIALKPKNADILSGQGLAYMGMQEYEQALESFNQAQDIKPDDPTIWIQKGIILKILQRPTEANMFYQEALAVYDEKTAKNRDNPLLWTDRGFVLLQLNRPQDAFAAYDRALMLNENFYEALLGKANVLIVVGDHQQALEVLDRAKEIRPKDYQVWHNRGNILLQALNDPEAASTSFERATQLKADFYPAWLGWGLALNTAQKYPDALTALNKAKELNPQDPIVWMNQGLVLEKLGELEAAIEAYKVAEIELQFPPAKERLEQLGF